MLLQNDHPDGEMHSPALAVEERCPLAGLLAPARVVVNLDLSSRDELLAVAARCVDGIEHLSRAEVFDALVARERLCATALGKGIAIPHARLERLRETLGVYLRSRSPVPFDAPDGRGVTDAFVLLVPEHATEEHLMILARLGELFADRQFRETLRACEDPGTIVRLFR
ncbi:MAG: PTS sugar transporter subunit IIA [Burkholderiales bacterium]